MTTAADGLRLKLMDERSRGYTPRGSGPVANQTTAFSGPIRARFLKKKNAILIQCGGRMV